MYTLKKCSIGGGGGEEFIHNNHPDVCKMFFYLKLVEDPDQLNHLIPSATDYRYIIVAVHFGLLTLLNF